jgi:hypothetical protein
LQGTGGKCKAWERDKGAHCGINEVQPNQGVREEVCATMDKMIFIST